MATRARPRRARPKRERSADGTLRRRSAHDGAPAAAARPCRRLAPDGHGDRGSRRRIGAVARRTQCRFQRPCRRRDRGDRSADRRALRPRDAQEWPVLPRDRAPVRGPYAVRRQPGGAGGRPAPPGTCWSGGRGLPRRLGLPSVAAQGASADHESHPDTGDPTVRDRHVGQPDDPGRGIGAGLAPTGPSAVHHGDGGAEYRVAVGSGPAARQGLRSDRGRRGRKLALRRLVSGGVCGGRRIGLDPGCLAFPQGRTRRTAGSGPECDTMGSNPDGECTWIPRASPRITPPGT